MDRSIRWYRLLLRLLSPGLRRRHGEEMVGDFAAMLASGRRQGAAIGVLRVWIRALADLAFAVPHDRIQPFLHRRRRRLTPDPGRASMQSRLQDLRFALRVFRRQPLFAAVAILTVGVGVGATATIFSIANDLLLRVPQGVRGASDLVTVHRLADDGSSFHAFSVPLYRHLASSDGTGLAQIASYDQFAGGIVVDGTPWSVSGQVVSGNYFEALGTRAVIGRLFHASEDVVPGRDAVVVISERMWRDRLDADAEVVGRELRLNGRGYQIVGVAESGFRGHLAVFRADLWVPLAAHGLVTGRADLSEEASPAGLELIARRQPGVELVAVRDGLDRAARAFAVERGQTWNGVDVLGYTPTIPAAHFGLRIFLGALFALTGLLLAITSINVANMLLSRGAARAREIGVRLAMGATRGRLLAQLLTESALLFVAGGVTGALVTVGATALASRIDLPIPVALDLSFRPDLTVFAFALAISGVTGVVFGLTPALHATRGDLVGALKEGAGRLGARRRLRATLVVGQVAGSAVLLVAAGLLTRGLGGAVATDLGLEPEGITAFPIDGSSVNRGPEGTQHFFEAALEEARSMPDVEAAGMIDVPPLTGSNQQALLVLPGRPDVPGDGLRTVELARVAPGTLDALRIPLRSGRDVSIDDRPETPLAVVVNERFARSAWPESSAIGRRLEFRRGDDENLPAEVVGVAADSKVRTPFDSPRSMVYVAWTQFPSDEFTLLVRTARPAVGIAMRDRLRELEPALPPIPPTPYETLVGLSTLPARIVAGLAAAFGLAGLTLAAIGLYGLLAYAVVQQRREIGIRRALGADDRRVRALVLVDGLRLTGIGLGVGLGIAAIGARLLRGFLFGLSPFDPATYVAIAGTLGLVALLACWLPARRAVAEDPVAALRAD